MRVLITGANGFVGPHLARSLLASGHEVIALAGPGAAEPSLEIRDPAAVKQRLGDARPDAVVHLAGWSSVGSSFEQPLECFSVNALGSAVLFEAVRTQAPNARVLLISSGEVYGRSEHRQPRQEASPLAPASPYAMSKYAAELVAQQYQAAFGIHSVIARAFNHVGPGQDQRFVVPSLVRQIHDVACGRGEPVIRVGNLEPVRDFSSVHDVVEAYRLLLERGLPGEVYNVCSGRGRSIREVLEELLRLAGVEANIEIDPAKVRAAEVSHLVGDPAKLMQLGWQPTTDVFSPLFGEPPSPSSPGEAHSN
jgi:GDP-4-dehydro-6-deoxy-D-mannose reductase